MPRLILFGVGYTGSRIADAVERAGGTVDRVTRATAAEDIRAALQLASHVLSTVPPVDDQDPILSAYGDLVRRIGWIGYLSSTGVYGDTNGAWVDESSTLLGRRGGRIAADLAWQAIGARIFRLPGIYGPGRTAIERLRSGRAHRVDLPEQVFCRIHVDDIIGAVLAAIERGDPGVYNISDDVPTPQNDVIEYGCRLLGLAVPPLMTLEQLNLSPTARAFYSENRRVANGKAKRHLKWRPSYPSYREGLASIVRDSIGPA